MKKQLWGYKVPFHEQEVNPIFVKGNRYFEKQDIISIAEFLKDTKFPKEAVEDKYFWLSLKKVIRPIFERGHIVAVVLNLKEDMNVLDEIDKL